MPTQYCCSICLAVKQAYDFTAWLRWKELHGEELAGEPVDDECVRTMFAKIRETQQANAKKKEECCIICGSKEKLSKGGQPPNPIFLCLECGTKSILLPKPMSN